MAFGRSKSRKPSGSEGAAPKPSGLAGVMAQGIALQEDRAKLLRKGVDEGLAFFQQYNDSRLKLAFDSFDEAMRNALFEVIYLLHFNDPSLERIAYTATRKDNSTGVPRYVSEPAESNLYVEGAPHGIRTIETLSPVFREGYQEYIRGLFPKAEPTGGTNGLRPIVCLQSIGSIGTIGHKSGTSDLDLQVIYDLYRFPDDLYSWSDGDFRKLIDTEHDLWINMLGRQKKLSREEAGKQSVRQELADQATQRMSQVYPNLLKYLVREEGDYLRDLKAAQGITLRSRLLMELTALVKRHTRIAQADQVKQDEQLLKERVGRIQEYIESKYPQAEIYMFTMSLDMYRAGRYMSSLEFKESSGSAYELILNYETLMPGIQFTSTIPAHFVLPPEVNNDPTLYQRLSTFIEFQAMDIYQDVSPLMVDLGGTPSLDSGYVAKHMPAAYWEAFKASSGNLYKATLNLLRFEMLIEKKFDQTIIQIIKNPQLINHLISPRPENLQEAENAMRRQDSGMPNWMLIEMEFDAPELLKDPWWARYKALKVGFCEADGVVGLEDGQRDRISQLIDLAFALHVRISDVFSKPGDTRKFESHREQVLRKFLESAFPKDTAKRERLEHIFSGEVSAVNAFENDLRANFRWSLERTKLRISHLGVEQQQQKNQEVELWHRHYLEYFEPKPNVVEKTIMHHLKFPRGRLQIGFKKGEGWFFRSLQKASSVGKRFDTFGVLSHLPDEVTLIEGSAFLHGLATCIVNGYYGILNRGSLKETRTALEFDAKHMNMGNDLDNTKAFISPDYIERMLERILEFFPYEYHHYLDFIRVERRLDRIYLFVNLWHFGRLSILYRDNLNTWYCDEFDHQELWEKGETLNKDPEAFLSAEALHETFDRFLVNQRLFIDEVSVKTWVNPNSLETRHSPFQAELKERELADAFEAEILKIHPRLNRGK